MKSVLFIISMLLIGSSICKCQETCIKQAWIEYNKQNWQAAIKNAEDCIFNFDPQAQNIQSELKLKKYNLPSNYSVPKGLTAQQKDDIFSHGLLNDVATAYWIAGMSNKRMGNNTTANKAFQKATNLSFGLCYNPEKDLFWSPCDDAKLRINK